MERYTSFMNWKDGKVKVKSEVAQSRPTLCDPMDCSPPGSSIHRILQAAILEWVVISFSREPSRPRNRTQVSLIAGRRFNLWAKREAWKDDNFLQIDLSNSSKKPSRYFVIVVFVVQSLSHVWLFVTPWTAAHQASLSFTVSQSLLKLMSIESVMPSNHLILCRPLLLLPSISPSITVFFSESALRIRWPKYWSFNLNISPSNEYSGLISFRIDGFDLLVL